MNLGNFCVCLNVKDIHKSKEFYENLAFKAVSGDISQNWIVMKNGSCKIGLFQGMFERNVMTFNPGWDENANKLESFTDVRELQRQIKAKGIELQTEADEKTSGPAYLILEDPDGNPIYIDQHV